MSSQTENSNSDEPVIRCDSVYKIFGDNAETMLENSGGVVDAAKFHESGCIVGVNNASFEVYAGELLIIMGLSGSGKSTLLRCISRLSDATAGNIYIDGEDILSMSSKQLIELRRNKMGMVFRRSTTLWTWASAFNKAARSILSCMSVYIALFGNNGFGNNGFGFGIAEF